MSEEIVFDYDLSSAIECVGAGAFARSTNLKTIRNRLERDNDGTRTTSVTGLSGRSKGSGGTLSWTIRLDWDERKGDHWNVDLKHRGNRGHVTTRKLAFISMSRTDYERGRLSTYPSASYSHMLQSFWYAAGVAHHVGDADLDTIVENGESVAARSLQREWMARTMLYGEPDWDIRRIC